MSQYSAGSVDTTAGSNIITGNGTEWLSYISSGDAILIEDDAVFYIVSAVATDTQLTITANYPTTKSGEDYVINTDFTTNKALPLANQGDLHFADTYSQAMQLIDAALNFGLTYLGTVIDKDLTAAPSSGLSVGDTYIVGSPVATGDEWFGHEYEIAIYTGTSGDPWDFSVPDDGDFVYVVDEQNLYLYDSGTWYVFAVGISVEGVPADTMFWLNSPTNTIGFKWNSATSRIEFWISGVRAGYFS